jgi:hypothetical protein
VAADEVLPPVGHGPVRGSDGAGDVLVDVEAVVRRPARQEDVDQHQRVVVGEVDVDVVRRVVRAVPRQVDPLAADAQRTPGLERLVGQRHGSLRIVAPGQQPPGLDVADPYDVVAEHRRRADVVGVVVRVDDVGHLVGHTVVRRDPVDGPLQVAPDRRWRVEQHDALPGGQEGRLVGAVGDPVEVLLHPPDEVALRVERRAERGRGNRGEVGQPGRRRRPGEGPPARVATAGMAAIVALRARNERRFSAESDVMACSPLSWRDWSLATSGPAGARSWARMPRPPRT